MGPHVAALDLWGSVLLPVCRPLTCWAAPPIGATTIRIVRPACCRRRRPHPGSPLGLHGCMSHTCAGESAWAAQVIQAITRSSRLQTQQTLQFAGPAQTATANLRRLVNPCPCLHHMGPWTRSHRRWPERLRWPVSFWPSLRQCCACRALQGFHIPVGCHHCGQGHTLRACVDHGAERPCSTCGSHKVGASMMWTRDGFCALCPAGRLISSCGCHKV